MEHHRNTEQKLKSQEKELEKKITQLKLEELTKKNTKQIQTPIKKEESEQITLMSPVNAPLPAIQPSPLATVPQIHGNSHLGGGGGLFCRLK